MTVSYIPFESKSGFKSPGFSVNETGDLIVNGSVLFTSQLDVAPTFTVNGVLIIDNTDSVVSLGNQIKKSSLTSLGILERLEVDGDINIAQGSSPYIKIENGVVSINSVAAVGTIDNIDIGLKDPGDANFKSVNIGPGDSSGELSVQGNVSVTQNIDVNGEIDVVGNITTNSFVNLGVTPTAANHATRKDYVDSRISAFAIAFGA